MHPYPLESDGQSLQGDYLFRGLKEIGEEVMQCDRGNSFHKTWVYEHFKPDVAIGVGFWADTPLNHGLKAVPWFNADGWVANYQDDLNKLPLIVATSNWVKSTYIRDGVKGDNIEVCSIGFDPAVFYPRQKNDPAVLKLREMLEIKEDEKMILTAGGDVTSKGAQEMLQALAKIDKEFPKWKYVCKTMDSFSAKNHGKEEKSLIKELGLDKHKIKYLSEDFSPDFMALLLNACDIYAAPSRLEGFGMIQVEAMACGTPVIGYNHGAIAEVIKDGETGFVVSNVEEMTEAVKKISGINKNICRDYVKDNFNIEKVIDGYEMIYKQVAERKKFHSFIYPLTKMGIASNKNLSWVGSYIRKNIINGGMIQNRATRE